MRAILLAVALLTSCADTYDYDATNAGEDDQGARAPRGKTPSQFVRGVYTDVVGRAPDRHDITVSFGTQSFVFQLDEQATLVSALDGLGDSQPLRNLITAGLLHSIEVTLPDKSAVEPTKFIREQFAKLLGREPNAYELAVFADAWTHDPAVGPRTIIRAIIGSREYQSQ